MAAAQDIRVAEGPAKGVELKIAAPDTTFGWWRRHELLLVAYQVDKNGKLDREHPTAVAASSFIVSDEAFSVLISVIVVALAYLWVVLATGRYDGKYAFDPVYLTSDQFDRASLSQLQIFVFTLVVLGLLTYVLLRVAVLSEISSDILVLLGISALGAAGSKVADQMKRRLSFDNWAWLRNTGWLTVYEAGTGGESHPQRARWADLLRNESGLDVYSFQMAALSVVVAYALLTTEFEKIANFSIPEHLKALLGLSNVVYIGGKAVTPNSVGELDQKVRELREAESAWFSPIMPDLLAETSQPAKAAVAMQKAPAGYASYLAIAREAARMLRSIYGSAGTRFPPGPIPDSMLLPVFP